MVFYSAENANSAEAARSICCSLPLSRGIAVNADGERYRPQASVYYAVIDAARISPDNRVIKAVNSLPCLKKSESAVFFVICSDPDDPCDTERLGKKICGLLDKKIHNAGIFCL